MRLDLFKVGVEGFERQRPTVPDPLLVRKMAIKKAKLAA